MKKLILLCSFGLLGNFVMAGSVTETEMLLDTEKTCVITTTTTTTTTNPDGTVTTTTVTTQTPYPKTTIVITIEG
ncbi:MAG: hypothetical protein PHC38_07315 [Weeksellaceae bacterium]|nr:hypothetical protein [Weeksellaceae bacterium]